MEMDDDSGYELMLEDGTVIGSTDYFTGEQKPIRLGSIPHNSYDLDDEFKDLHEDTRVLIGGPQ